jgi:amino acid transporter
MGDKIFEFEFATDWIEAFALLALILGVFIGFATGSAFTAYVLSVLSGLLFGRQWHRSRKGPRLPYFLVITGFLIGFLIGSLPYADPKPSIVLFVIGMLIGYYCRKECFTTVRY